MEPGEWPVPGGRSAPWGAVIQGRERKADAGSGVYVLPDHPAVVAVLSALICAGPNAATSGWRWNEGVASFSRPGRPTVVLMPMPGDSPRDAVARIGPLTLDVLTTLLFTAASADWLVDGGVRVPVGLFRDVKGIRRCGVERREFDRNVRAQLATVAGVAVQATRAAQRREFEPLFQFEVSDACPEFRVRLGAWSADCGAHLPFDREILRLDHRSNRGAEVLAKKLALHLTLGVRTASARRSVRRLLMAVGELPEGFGSSACRSGRLADRFEEALMQLNERGLFHIRYHSERGGAVNRTKGWVKTWLDTSVEIGRPTSCVRSEARTQRWASLASP